MPFIGIESPEGAAAICVVQDVAEYVELVRSIGDRFWMRALGPESPGVGAETGLAQAVRGVLFRSSNPMARIVIDETRQNVQVDAIERRDQDFNLVVPKFFDDAIHYKLSQMSRDAHAIPFHEGFGEFVERIIHAWRWRVFIISFHMLAMMPRAPTARIPAQP